MVGVAVDTAPDALCRNWTNGVLLPLACGLLTPSLPAFAQVAAPAGSAHDLCHVFAIEADEGAPKDLRASCQGRGLMLGSATSFEASENAALKATLVMAHLGAERRVLLLTLQDDGRPLVEDLTGQIALEAGRGPMSEIDGVDLDLSAFAQAGEISVRPPVQGRTIAQAGRINLGEQISAERARQSASAQIQE